MNSDTWNIRDGFNLLHVFTGEGLSIEYGKNGLVRLMQSSKEGNSAEMVAAFSWPSSVIRISCPTVKRSPRRGASSRLLLPSVSDRLRGRSRRGASLQGMGK